MSAGGREAGARELQGMGGDDEGVRHNRANHGTPTRQGEVLEVRCVQWLHHGEVAEGLTWSSSPLQRQRTHRTPRLRLRWTRSGSCRCA